MRKSGSGGVLTVLRTALLRAGILLVVALFPAVVSGWLNWQGAGEYGNNPSVTEISASDALLLSKDQHVLWIDARDRRAFDEGHIAGAVSLPEDEWENSLPALIKAWEPGFPVVVYCSGLRCDASRSVAGRLVHEFTMKNIFILKGGWDAWLQKGK
jgi:rhodanese-related sulfurtransferase